MNIHEYYKHMSRLNERLKGQKVNRRRLLKATMVGAGLSSMGMMLAACESDDDDGDIAATDDTEDEEVVEDPDDVADTDDEVEADDAADDTDEPEPTEDSDDADEAPADTDQEFSGQLSLLLGSHMDPIKELVETYNDEYGVQPNVEEITSPDLQTVMTGAFIAQSSPWDSVFLTAGLIANVADQGWLEPMDDFIAEIRERGEGEFLEGGLVASEYDGQVWAVPWALGCPILHWNRQLFEDAGLDPDAPKTWHETQNSWDEFVEYAVELTGERNGQQIYGLTAAWAEDHVLFEWGALLLMQGGQWFDEDGQPAFNSEAGVAATEKLYDLLHTYECIDPAARTYTWVFDAAPGYLDGTRAMFLTWPFIGGVANFGEDSLIQGQSDAAPYPAIETSASMDGSEFLGIPIFSDNQDEARRFLEMVTSREGQRVIAEGGWAGVYSDVMQEDDILEQYPFYTALAQSYEYPVDRGFSPDFTIWTDLLANEIHEALAGNKSPQEALDDAARRISEDRADN